MSDKTNIAWCDSTWNWIIGCTKVSPGCANCYAEASMPSKMFGVEWGDNGERRVAANATFNAPLKWNKKPWVCDECKTPTSDNDSTCNYRDEDGICCQALSYHRRRVFSLSLGDWLDPKIPVPVLVQALDIIRRCPNMDFLLCTKRPELFSSRLRAALDWSWQNVEKGPMTKWHLWVAAWQAQGKPPPNVWILVSVEDQQRADERIPHLLRIPAVVRGLSVEPLLGPIDLGHSVPCGYYCDEPIRHVDHQFWDAGKCNHPDGIHWVIVGGESGPKARPCQVEWVRSIVQQCQQASVPCFVKQVGSNSVFEYEPGLLQSAGKLKHPKGGDPSEWPADLSVREFPTVRLP